VEGGDVFEPFEFFPSTVFGPISEGESGSDAVENAEEFVRLCRDRDSEHPIVSWIALNSALALHCMNRVETIAEGVELVQGQFKDNKILPFVETVIKESKGV
jgi:anthranilate phosphoribosyltransferase